MCYSQIIIIKQQYLKCNRKPPKVNKKPLQFWLNVVRLELYIEVINFDSQIIEIFQ